MSAPRPTREFSRGVIDRLGEALRDHDPTPDEVDLFNRYRESFRTAIDEVVTAVRAATTAEVAERQKTLRSTAAKLRRETARLSQVQDVAGCRVVVHDVAAQDRLVSALAGDHETWRVVDRRRKPSHGYRAVHVIARIDARPVEIQVRTAMQHSWADLSEAWDRRFPGVKYGRGPDDVVGLLAQRSDAIAIWEEAEPLLDSAFELVSRLPDESWVETHRRMVANTKSKLASELARRVEATPAGNRAFVEALAGERQKAHTALMVALRRAFPAEVEDG